MAKAHAAGKLAFGFCDRCGFRYLLSDLRQETINQVLVNIKTCPKCWDEDHPQYRVGRRSYHDPQALLNPRPDTSQDESRYGTSVRYEFDSNLEGWSAVVGSTLTWLSTKEVELVSSVGLDGITRNSVNKINLDPSYNYVEIRLKSISESSASDWVGKLSWRRDIDISFSNSLFESRPPFGQMGEQYHVISFDLRNDSNWSDVIERVRFDPYVIGSNTIRIDYIRFEKRQ